MADCSARLIVGLGWYEGEEEYLAGGGSLGGSEKAGVARKKGPSLCWRNGVGDEGRSGVSEGAPQSCLLRQCQY